MIIFKGKEITTLIIENKKIIYIFYGDKLLWQTVGSCFGAGYWINEKPFINEEGWKN